MTCHEWVDRLGIVQVGGVEARFLYECRRRYSRRRRPRLRDLQPGRVALCCGRTRRRHGWRLGRRSGRRRCRLGGWWQRSCLVLDRRRWWLGRRCHRRPAQIGYDQLLRLGRRRPVNRGRRRRRARHAGRRERTRLDRRRCGGPRCGGRSRLGDNRHHQRSAVLRRLEAQHRCNPQQRQRVHERGDEKEDASARGSWPERFEVGALNRRRRFRGNGSKRRATCTASPRRRQVSNVR